LLGSCKQTNKQTNGTVLEYSILGKFLAIANLICSYRVSCACEPSVLSIPNGISCVIRHTTVARIMRPCSFSFKFGVGSPSCVRFTSTRVVIVPYSKSFRHQSVLIGLLSSSKIHIRDSCETCYSMFSVHPNQWVMTYFGFIEAP
jgi:hypothetical protein